MTVTREDSALPSLGLRPSFVPTSKNLSAATTLPRRAWVRSLLQRLTPPAHNLWQVPLQYAGAVTDSVLKVWARLASATRLLISSHFASAVPRFIDKIPARRRFRQNAGIGLARVAAARRGVSLARLSQVQRHRRVWLQRSQPLPVRILRQARKWAAILVAQFTQWSASARDPPSPSRTHSLLRSTAAWSLSRAYALGQLAQRVNTRTTQFGVYVLNVFALAAILPPGMAVILAYTGTRSLASCSPDTHSETCRLWTNIAAVAGAAQALKAPHLGILAAFLCFCPRQLLWWPARQSSEQQGALPVTTVTLLSRLQAYRDQHGPQAEPTWRTATNKSDRRLALHLKCLRRHCKLTIGRSLLGGQMEEIKGRVAHGNCCWMQKCFK